ncbi:MAG: D-proline reductase (dithiol) proprotein PrdA [Lachnospirales bacterium]
MAMSQEKAQKNAKKHAVTCCRFEAGSTVTPDMLEDPAIFDDLVESGLLSLSDDTLKIEEVLGLTLNKTLDALTPFTKDVVDGYVAKKEEKIEKVATEGAGVVNTTSTTNSTALNGGVLRIQIEKGEGINIELPLGILQGASSVSNNEATNSVNENTTGASKNENENNVKELERLEKHYYKIDKVVLSDKTEIIDNVLYVKESLCKEVVTDNKIVKSIKLEIVTSENYDVYSETIMDVQPIAVKEKGELGSGITRVIDNVVVVLTGIDEVGSQIGEFGSSEGSLDKNIMWGRPGAPDKGNILIKAEVVIKEAMNMERPGPFAAHKVMDMITKEIRDALLKAEGLTKVDTEILVHKSNPSKKRVLIVKEIMGQGAMHDNFILPTQPCGMLGGKPNVDLGNLPVVLSPLELLDGGIHALTCIGPASKETTRHYFREPLVKLALADENIELLGVCLVGSPQANTEKDYVSRRLGMLAQTMNLDGAIITTEGFGNNHIDFASHHEQIGKRGAKVVGVTYSAVQGALVVGNEYMYALIDNNKSKQGIENEILSNNTLCEEDGIRALAMLNHLMDGNEVEEAERKWNPNVKLGNVSVIEKATGTKMNLVENEQVLPKSKKRLEIYEVE